MRIWHLDYSPVLTILVLPSPRHILILRMHVSVLPTAVALSLWHKDDRPMALADRPMHEVNLPMAFANLRTGVVILPTAVALSLWHKDDRPMGIADRPMHEVNLPMAFANLRMGDVILPMILANLPIGFVKLRTGVVFVIAKRAKSCVRFYKHPFPENIPCLNSNSKLIFAPFFSSIILIDQYDSMERYACCY
jgi:hypothetical protein